MIAYADPNQLRDYLQQLPDSADDEGKTDATLGQILDRATSIVEDTLGFAFAPYGDAAAQQVRGNGTAWLTLPPHQWGSVTSVVDGAGVTVAADAWEELADGAIYLVDQYGNEGNWYRGRYTVTAVWGYGEPPASIVQLVLELAVNMWRTRDKGSFSEVLGVEGAGSQRYVGGLTNQQRMIIENVQRKFAGSMVV